MKVKIGDWVKFRSGGPMIHWEHIGEVLSFDGKYICVQLPEKQPTIELSQVIEVRKP